MSNSGKKVDEIEGTAVDNSNEVNKEEVSSVDITDCFFEKDIYSNEDNISKKKKIVIISGVVIILLIIVSLLFWWISNKKTVNKYANKVYPEVYVSSMVVGDLNEVALSKVLSEKDVEVLNSTVKVTVNGKEYSSTYTELDVKTNKDELIGEIMSYGKDKSFKEKLDLIKEPKKKIFELEASINEENIKEFVAKIAEEVKVEPVNASARILAGVVEVVEGQDGYQLDQEAIIDSIKSQISAEDGGIDVIIDGTLVAVNPEITGDKLKTIDTRVSTFTTYFSNGNSGINIQTGASYFNNTLLMPGEEFSCTDAIGPTIAERGFVNANTYVGGQVVPGMGGGVCQIATTVYNAELRAGLLPTERQNHMMTVGYVGIGLDATLADNLIDLRFVNTYDYPLIITTASSGGALTVEIWSNSNATNGYSYQPRVEAISSLSCYTYLDKYDAAGNLVDSIYLNQSVYQPFS